MGCPGVGPVAGLDVVHRHTSVGAQSATMGPPGLRSVTASARRWRRPTAGEGGATKSTELGRWSAPGRPPRRPGPPCRRHAGHLVDQSAVGQGPVQVCTAGYSGSVSAPPDDGGEDVARAHGADPSAGPLLAPDSLRLGTVWTPVLEGHRPRFTVHR